MWRDAGGGEDISWDAMWDAQACIHPTRQLHQTIQQKNLISNQSDLYTEVPESRSLVSPPPQYHQTAGNTNRHDADGHIL